MCVSLRPPIVDDHMLQGAVIVKAKQRLVSLFFIVTWQVIRSLRLTFIPHKHTVRGEAYLLSAVTECRSRSVAKRQLVD